jgi:hypothetical protein
MMPRVLCGLIIAISVTVTVTAQEPVADAVKNIVIRHEAELAGSKFAFDVLGQPTRGVFKAADETGIMVDAGVPVVVMWADMSAKRLVPIALKAAVSLDETIVVIRLAKCAGLTDDAGKMIEDAVTKFPDGKDKLEALRKELFPPEVPAAKAAKAAETGEEEPPFKSTPAGPNGSIPGEIMPDPGTLHCVSVRWPVKGDENKNAVIGVEYRKAGEKKWRPAMPLFRCETAALVEKPPEGCWMFAGSVLNLVPDTNYEVRLRLIDPDGGNTEKLLTLQTWKEPFAPQPLRTLHVVQGDGGGNGTAENPFRGLGAAGAASRPGDLFLIHRGIYKGTFEVPKDGTAEAPIVWQGAGDGEAIIDGGGAHRGISASDRKYMFFENLTVQNAIWGMVAHGGAYLTIRRLKFQNIEYGFVATKTNGGQTCIFLADCTMQGPSVWPREKGIENARGVQITGTGIEVCYNRIRGFADGIDTFQSPPVRAVDFHNNDLMVLTDDGIETDYSEQNMRCFKNRITNAFQGISLQPVFGGPIYVYRNMVYGVEAEPYKLHNSPSGGVIMHNTTVTSGMPINVASPGAPIRNTILRNNLLIGSTKGGNYFMEMSQEMPGCDFDYDAYIGGPFPRFAKWCEGRIFGTMEEFTRGTGNEAHGICMSKYDGILASVKLPLADARAQEFTPEANDLRLAQNSPLIDKGVIIPTVNDNFTGAAPDIGCYEFGDPVPQYGPRPLPSQNAPASPTPEKAKEGVAK